MLLLWAYVAARTTIKDLNVKALALISPSLAPYNFNFFKEVFEQVLSHSRSARQAKRTQSHYSRKLYAGFRNGLRAMSRGTTQSIYDGVLRQMVHVARRFVFPLFLFLDLLLPRPLEVFFLAPDLLVLAFFDCSTSLEGSLFSKARDSWFECLGCSFGDSTSSGFFALRKASTKRSKHFFIP